MDVDVLGCNILINIGIYQPILGEGALSPYQHYWGREGGQELCIHIHTHTHIYIN